MVRTRTDAARLVVGGLVRLNGRRVEASSQAVRLGDVLTVALDRRIRLLQVTGFADRRGDADAARALFEDVSPVEPPSAPRSAAGIREPGSGRPTKRQRRQIDRLMHGVAGDAGDDA